MIQVICRKNGSTSKVFTDGKIYDTFAGPGNLLAVKDDFGTMRYILPDCPSPHLIKETRRELFPFVSQTVVGRFETVK